MAAKPPKTTEPNQSSDKSGQVADSFFDSLPPEVQAKLNTFSRLKRRNRIAMLRRFEAGKTAQGEEKLLNADGLIDTPVRGEKAQADTDICDSMEELANRMMMHYQNPDKSSKLRITITKKTISEWSQAKRLAGIPKPPKPIAGVRRTWSLRAWLAWFDANMWHDYRVNDSQTNGDTSAKMPMGELREIKEREQIEFERWEIVKEMGGYIALPLAERIAAGESRKYHDQWKSRLEITLIETFTARAQGLNIEPEKAAVLAQFLTVEFQKMTDAVEVASEKFAGDFAEKLKAEMKAGDRQQ
jgi:hypothetical protein